MATKRIGRPSSYDPAFCEVAISFLTQGYSTTALAGHIGVARSTLYKWADDNASFSDALKTGQAMSAIWWENCLRDVARGANGSAAAAIFGLKNRASEDWREKVVNEHTGKDGGPLSVEVSAREQVASRLAGIAARTGAAGDTEGAD